MTIPPDGPALIRLAIDRVQSGAGAHRVSMTHTLTQIVEACPHRWADGSVTGALGGTALQTACGARRTFFRHLAMLVPAGAVVVLVEGGIRRGTAIASIYGVPATVGALDNRAARRRMTSMYRCSDGVHRPVVTEPGQQAELYPPTAFPANAPSATVALVPRWHKCHGGTPSGSDGSDGKNPDGSGASRDRSERNKTKRPSLHNIVAVDLSDTDRLLALFDQAVEKGVTSQGERALHEFVAAAEHATRSASRNAAGLFYAIAIKGQHRDKISNEADEAARRRLNRHREQHDPHARRFAGKSAIEDVMGWE